MDAQLCAQNPFRFNLSRSLLENYSVQSKEFTSRPRNSDRISSSIVSIDKGADGGNRYVLLIIDNTTKNSAAVSRSTDFFPPSPALDEKKERGELISSERGLFRRRALRYLEIYSNAQRDVISLSGGGDDAMPECSLVPRTERASRRTHLQLLDRRLSSFNGAGRITPVNFATRDTG